MFEIVQQLVENPLEAFDYVDLHEDLKDDYAQALKVLTNPDKSVIGTFVKDEINPISLAI